MVTRGSSPHKENPHGRAGNRTRDLVISSHKLRPPDHEAGQTQICHKVTRTASNQQLFCPYISINFQRIEKCFKQNLYFMPCTNILNDLL
jgi:hypothetical protein